MFTKGFEKVAAVKVSQGFFGTPITSAGTLNADAQRVSKTRGIATGMGAKPAPANVGAPNSGS